MNYSEIIAVTTDFMKYEAVKRKKEAQKFYEKTVFINLATCFLGYVVMIKIAAILPDNFAYFSIFDVIMFILSTSFLSISLYYLGTLLHDYIHAEQYYSKRANFAMKYLLPIVFPLNASAYRWGHFSHHSNTNRYEEKLDTLPPFINQKTLGAFWLNVIIHSFMLSLILIVRLMIKPFFMVSEKTQLIYFNYISPIGLVSPQAYSLRKNYKEFSKILIGDSITLGCFLIFWEMSKLSMMFIFMYLFTLVITASCIAFRTLVDHALINVKGQEGAMKANFYFTSNFSEKYFWYAGFATYHLLHHINSSIPNYFCKEVNDILCQQFPEYHKLHEKRNNLRLIIRDFFSKNIQEADLLNI